MVKINMTIVVTNDTFKKEVLESSIPVLVDFWASWCGPCKALAPTIDQVSEEFNGKVKVVKIDVSENQDISSQFKIQSIPTLILFKDGKILDTKIGSLPKNNLVEWITKSIIS